jgi:L-lactate dehydrogenase complex protein LldG
LSSSDHPSEFNFLAATHIVIVQAAMVLGSFEELWSRLRTDYPENWPRMMNFIVGPSRTADLGVPSRLGAHGPSRVHIIVIRS